MKGNRFALEIERFVLRARSPQVDFNLKRPGSSASDLSDMLEFDGWLATGAPIRSVRLELPGETSLDLACDPSDGRHRLRLCSPMPDSPVLDDAALAVQAGDDRFFVQVGHLLRRPNWWPRMARFAPDPEGLPLAPLDAAGLAEAIACGPDAIDLADLYLSPRDGAWTAISHRTGMRLETGIEAADLDSARAQAWPKMREALAALIETLDDAAPLLVYRRTAGDTDETMRDLFERVRARNPDAALLWRDPHRTPGPVVRWREEPWATPGLLLLASDTDEPAATIASARAHMLAPR